jgi:hypothetical protein
MAEDVPIERRASQGSQLAMVQPGFIHEDQFRDHPGKDETYDV